MTVFSLLFEILGVVVSVASASVAFLRLWATKVLSDYVKQDILLLMAEERL